MVAIVVVVVTVVLGAVMVIDFVVMVMSAVDGVVLNMLIIFFVMALVVIISIRVIFDCTPSPRPEIWDLSLIYLATCSNLCISGPRAAVISKPCPQ